MAHIVDSTTKLFARVHLPSVRYTVDGLAVFQARIAAQHTQQFVANRLKVSRAFISVIESDDAESLKLEHVLALQELYPELQRCDEIHTGAQSTTPIDSPSEEQYEEIVEEPYDDESDAEVEALFEDLNFDEPNEF